MSDLFGNHIVGFPTRRLIYQQTCQGVLFYLNALSAALLHIRLLSIKLINYSDKIKIKIYLRGLVPTVVKGINQ